MNCLIKLSDPVGNRLAAIGVGWSLGIYLQLR